VSVAPVRPRNDPAQYDDLADQWWRPDGAFAALHWLAEARARLVPPAPCEGALLVDAGCGGGLLAPHVPQGYRHVGIDANAAALQLAALHGVAPVRADLAALPLPDASADVVVAGEVLEHVTDLDAVVAELARVLRPGGTFVCDTINATRWARFSLVTVGERLPGGPPPRIHDPALFVPPERLVALCARFGIALRVSGLQPTSGDYLRFLLDRRRPVRMRRTRSLSAVYQGVGVKTMTA
jgi:2-polyprenyl-6-hydroxyphenyl methylase/3-demethylubiquinone-9 3-methyltransferase